MPPSTLVIISCNESDPRIDPVRYFNLSASGTTHIIKTAGGHIEAAFDQLRALQQGKGVGMVVVVQHTECGLSTSGDVEGTIRADIQTLKRSSIVGPEIPVIGYLLDIATAQLKEVILRQGREEEARQQVLREFEGIAPFWG